MKNRNLIIGLVVLAVVLIVGGIFVLSLNKNKSTEQAEVIQEEQIPEETVSILTAEDIGLTLTETSDGRKVIMEISKVDDIASLEYQLSYTSKGGIPRGAIGTDIMPNGKAVRQEIVLGTCSDVCHYDQEVSDIKIIVGLTKTDNKVYSVEQSL